MYKVICLLLATLALSACGSQTPGDAALRSCHAQQAIKLYEKHAIMTRDALAAIKAAKLYEGGVDVSRCNVADKTGLKPNQQKARYWYKKAEEFGGVPYNVSYTGQSYNR